MQVWQEYQRISRLLAVSVKMRVRWAVPVYLERARCLQDLTSLYTTSLDVLRRYFLHATPEELDVLAFYLLGALVALQSESGQEGTMQSGFALASTEGVLRNRLQSLSEPSLTESLRLQMSMDRVSKFIQVLSNVLKKIRSTDETLVQNLK